MVSSRQAAVEIVLACDEDDVLLAGFLREVKHRLCMRVGVRSTNVVSLLTPMLVANERFKGSNLVNNVELVHRMLKSGTIPVLCEVHLSLFLPSSYSDQ